jgi:hypothetical protein
MLGFKPTASDKLLFTRFHSLHEAYYRLTNAVLLNYEVYKAYFGKSHGYANFGTDFKTSSSL